MSPVFGTVSSLHPTSFLIYLFTILVVFSNVPGISVSRSKSAAVLFCLFSHSLRHLLLHYLMTNASFKTTYNSLIFTHSGASVASFSDDRCEADGVCPSDPLTFTCEINGALSLRVVFPSSN